MSGPGYHMRCKIVGIADPKYRDGIVTEIKNRKSMETEDYSQQRAYR